MVIIIIITTTSHQSSNSFLQHVAKCICLGNTFWQFFFFFDIGMTITYSKCLLYLFGPEAMPQHMLQHNEKVLKWHVIRVKHSSKLQWCLYQLFHYQFWNVHKIAPLNNNRISGCNKVRYQLNTQQMVEYYLHKINTLKVWKTIQYVYFYFHKVNQWETAKIMQIGN